MARPARLGANAWRLGLLAALVVVWEGATRGGLIAPFWVSSPSLIVADILRALTGAVTWGVSHQKEPQLVDKAIQDCKEILDVVMAGKVEEWLN